MGIGQTETTLTPEEYFSFGKLMGTEILRHRNLDGSLSGILFKTEGKILTARHVVELNHLTGFKCHPGEHLDIAFKDVPLSQGLKIGYVDSSSIKGVQLLTSSLEKPNELIIIKGEIFLYFSPTILRGFSPVSHKLSDLLPYLKPGLSGSPLIYKDHIIGLVPFVNFYNQSEIPVLAFNGPVVREAIEQFGLTLEEIK